MKYAVCFTNNYGQVSIVVEANTQEEAIKLAVALDYVRAFSSVSASKIIQETEKFNPIFSAKQAQA